MKPNTKYTKSGRINIAYQVIGDGPIDIVYVPGWVSNIDLMWQSPRLVKFLKGLAKFARVILFDKRGTGLSDRVTDLSTLEERMDDIRAVMDAVDSKRAVLFGHSEGGSVSALFAATYPMRTHALITFGVFAKRRYSEDYPWAPTDEERQEVYDMIENSWGSGDMNLASLAPSAADDKVFMDWLASYFRSGASPSAAMVLTKMNTQVDIIDILDTIDVPTLLLYRTNDIDVKIEEGRFIAERIKGSKFVEFEGDDHLFWVGKTDEVLNEITEFLTGTRPIEKIERKLSTILFTDIAASTYHLTQLGDTEWYKILSEHNQILKKTIHQFRGEVIKNTGDGFLATFDGPSKAVHCAVAIRDAIQVLNIEIKQGIHTGEYIVTKDKDVAGLAVHIASRVLEQAGGNEILLTQTVKNLLSGTGLKFANLGPTQFKGISNPITLLTLQEHIQPTASSDSPNSKTATHAQNHSFLENVLQSIETHLSDENYGIDTLCQEVGVSERQLQRKLKSIANKTPNQMIRSVRLHRAKELLIERKRGVSEAAFDIGFSSLSYFTKCFKKEFGMAPTDLLREHM